MPSSHPAALACLVVLTALPAQRREPFSGVLRAPTGQPIAEARVVCECQPDGIVLGVPDRLEVKTAAEGHFAHPHGSPKARSRCA